MRGKLGLVFSTLVLLIAACDQPGTPKTTPDPPPALTGNATISNWASGNTGTVVVNTVSLTGQNLGDLGSFPVDGSGRFSYTLNVPAANLLRGFAADISPDCPQLTMSKPDTRYVPLAFNLRINGQNTRYRLDISDTYTLGLPRNVAALQYVDSAFTVRGQCATQGGSNFTATFDGSYVAGWNWAILAVDATASRGTATATTTLPSWAKWTALQLP